MLNPLIIWHYHLCGNPGRGSRRLGDQTTPVKASSDRRDKRPCLGIYGSGCYGFGAGAWTAARGVGGPARRSVCRCRSWCSPFTAGENASHGRVFRWRRGACDGENLLDATCPLLLQASVKLYGIGGHVVLLLIFVVEGWARSGSSPSASAQYISASFRHWRLCRGDFATAARRANFSALAR